MKLKVNTDPDCLARAMHKEIKEAVLRQYGVLKIAKVFGTPEIKDKSIVIEGLEELEGQLDDMSCCFCEPPFDDGTEAWGQIQTIRESVQDAIEYFKGLK